LKVKTTSPLRRRDRVKSRDELVQNECKNGSTQAKDLDGLA